MRRSRVVIGVLIATSIFVSVASGKETAPGPIPSQIATAKRVFISNAGSDLRFRQFGVTRTYDQFYAALKDWGHYELLSSPTDADLVFEINLIASFDQYGETYRAVPQLQLRIVDPKTHILLWTIAEPLEAGNFYIVGGHQNEKFDKAMVRLVKGLQELTNHGVPPQPTP